MTLAASDNLVRALRRAFDRRRDLEAEVHPAKVLGHNSDGTARLLRLDGECISRGGQSGYPGEIVTELPSLRDRSGTTGVAGAARITGASPLWVERLDPRALPAGSSGLVVEVSGHGFVPGMAWAFYLPGTATLNPDITLLGATYVDSETYDLTLAIATDAALLTDGTLGYDPENRPVPRYRKERAYDVTAAVGEDFLALWFLASDLVACRYNDGQHVETLGSVAETEFGETGLFQLQVIWSDTGGLVDDRSILWAADAQTIKVWDGLGETVLSLALDAGYSLAGPPVYQGGWIYWIERETSGGTGTGWWHRLCRCRADLTDGAGDPGYAVVSDDFFAALQPRPLVSSNFCAASSTTIEASYVDTDGVEDNYTRRVVYALDGSSVDVDGEPRSIAVQNGWLPEDSDSALGMTAFGPSRLAVGAETDPVALWDPEALLADVNGSAGFAEDLQKAAVAGSEDATPMIAVAYLDGSSSRKFIVTDPPEGSGGFMFWPLEP